MGYGYGMGYGHMMGFGYGGMFMMLLLLIIAVLALVAVTKNQRADTVRPRHELIIEILKHRYVTNEIDADRYLDMKRIIEKCPLDNDRVFTMQERFARGEISEETYQTGIRDIMGILTR